MKVEDIKKRLYYAKICEVTKYCNDCLAPMGYCAKQWSEQGILKEKIKELELLLVDEI